jgi:hypothetical protein
MAKKKEFKVKNVLLAGAGGIGANFLANQLEDKVFKTNQGLVAPAVCIGAIALDYFTSEDLSALSYGMLGAMAGDLGAEAVQGLSRVASIYAPVNALDEQAWSEYDAETMYDETDGEY